MGNSSTKPAKENSGSLAYTVAPLDEVISEELLLKILSDLDAEALVKAGRVSKKFHRVSLDPRLYISLVEKYITTESQVVLGNDYSTTDGELKKKKYFEFFKEHYVKAKLFNQILNEADKTNGWVFYQGKFYFIDEITRYFVVINVILLGYDVILRRFDEKFPKFIEQYNNMFGNDGVMWVDLPAAIKKDKIYQVSDGNKVSIGKYELLVHKFCAGYISLIHKGHLFAPLDRYLKYCNSSYSLQYVMEKFIDAPELSELSCVVETACERFGKIQPFMPLIEIFAGKKILPTFEMINQCLSHNDFQGMLYLHEISGISLVEVVKSIVESYAENPHAQNPMHISENHQLFLQQPKCMNLEWEEEGGKYNLLKYAVAVHSHPCVEFFMGNNCFNIETDAKNDIGHLQAAVVSNNRRSLQYLLQSGVNVNLATKDGLTALHLAVSEGNLPLVITLLRVGADPRLLANDHGDCRQVAQRKVDTVSNVDEQTLYIEILELITTKTAALELATTKTKNAELTSQNRELIVENNQLKHDNQVLQNDNKTLEDELLEKEREIAVLKQQLKVYETCASAKEDEAPSAGYSPRMFNGSR